jgi:hypothetical protein
LRHRFREVFERTIQLLVASSKSSGLVWFQFALGLLSVGFGIDTGATAVDVARGGALGCLILPRYNAVLLALSTQ